MSKRGFLQSDRDVEAAILEVVERFRTGWEKLDAGQILSTIAQRDDMVMYGTDLAERWIGYDALVEPTEAMVRAFRNPVYRWGESEPRVWARGDVGWACGDLSTRFEVGGELLSVTMRATFVVVREGDEWKIAHAHFSIGQEEAVAGYE